MNISPIRPIRPWRGSRLANLRDAIAELPIGGVFFYGACAQHPYLVSKQIGARITTRKMETGGWCVRRVA